MALVSCNKTSPLSTLQHKTLVGLNLHHKVIYNRSFNKVEERKPPPRTKKRTTSLSYCHVCTNWKDATKLYNYESQRIPTSTYGSTTFYNNKSGTCYPVSKVTEPAPPLQLNPFQGRRNTWWDFAGNSRHLKRFYMRISPWESCFRNRCRFCS